MPTSTKYKVAICLATFNGGKYLASQLDSLVNQDYPDINVFIHDDGSTDDTIEIIYDYKNRYPHMFTHIQDGIEYKNAGKNFLETLRLIKKHDFYMFCDQDDYWLKNKVSSAIKNITKNNYIPTIPTIFHTDATIVDEKLKIIKKSYWEEENIDFLKHCYQYYYHQNNIIGCTSAFNDCAKNILLSHNFPGDKLNIYHDWWLALTVSSVSNYKIIPSQNSQILYRQHSSNLVGTKRKKNKIRKFTPIFYTVFKYLNPYEYLKIYRKTHLKNLSFPMPEGYLKSLIYEIKRTHNKNKIKEKINP
jgi:rhamnosyltransferase